MTENEIINEIERLGEQSKVDDSPEISSQLDDLYVKLVTMFAESNPKEAIDNYLKHVNQISFDARVRIMDYLLEHNCSIDIFNSILSLQDWSNSEELEKKNAIDKKMIAKSEEGKFDLDNYSYKSDVYSSIDILYPFKKDINNVHNIFSKGYEYILYDIDQLLDYLISQKYEFTIQDKQLFEFIKKRPVLYNKFLRSCNFNQEIFDNIISYNSNFDEISILLSRFKDYFKDKDISLDIKNKEDNFINMISSLNLSDYNGLFKLKIGSINKDFLKKVKELLGDKVVVSPSDSFSIYYSIDDMLEIDKKIDTLAYSLQDKGDKKLSPLEKYVGAFIISTNFAIYRESNSNDYQSRSIYEIVKDPQNTYIVCVGYVNLMIELLKRSGMGKDVLEHSVLSASEHREMGSHLLDTNHARIIGHIKDDKYGVEFVCMSDPTWDSVKPYTKRGIRDFEYLFLSYDEALKDTEGFPKGVRDLHIDRQDIDSLSKSFGVDVSKLFNQKIDKDVFIRVICGIKRFLSKDGKMPLTADVSETGYSEFEYNSVALQLNLHEYFKFNKEMEQLSFKGMIEYLKDKYECSDGDITILLNRFITEKVGNYIYIETYNDELSVFVEYPFNNNRYTDEEIEKIYLSTNNDPSNFPRIRYPIENININSKIDEFISQVKANGDIVQNLEKEFDEITQKNVLK